MDRHHPPRLSPHLHIPKCIGSGQLALMNHTYANSISHTMLLGKDCRVPLIKKFWEILFFKNIYFLILIARALLHQELFAVEYGKHLFMYSQSH